MIHCKLSKNIGLLKFKILIEVDFDSFGDVESYEFFDGCSYYDNPSDIRFSKVFCDDSIQDEWDYFLNDVLQLFDSGILFKKIKKLNEEHNSYYFSEEEIKITLSEID